MNTTDSNTDAAYTVHMIGKSPAAGWSVKRNGVPVTGPDVLGAPAGHKTQEAAMAYAALLAAREKQAATAATNPSDASRD